MPGHAAALLASPSDPWLHASYPFTIRCGPLIVRWFLDHPAVAHALRYHWYETPTTAPADVEMYAQAAAVTPAQARRLIRPLQMHADEGGAAITVRFGTAAEAVWDRAARRMVCRYDAGMPTPTAVELFDILAANLIPLWLADHGGVVLHACGVLTDGAADLFVGCSGSGKSTLAASVAPERVLHDEGLIVFADAAGCWATPAPWRNAQWPHHVGRLWPVSRIFLLARQRQRLLERVPGVEALRLLLAEGPCELRRVSQPYGDRLALVGRLVEQRPCYRLQYQWPLDDPWALVSAATARRHMEES